MILYGKTVVYWQLLLIKAEYCFRFTVFAYVLSKTDPVQLAQINTLFIDVTTELLLIISARSSAWQYIGLNA